MTLFDLCAWFGYNDTALALAQHGVAGCTFEEYHLRPYSKAKKIPGFSRHLQFADSYGDYRACPFCQYKSLRDVDDTCRFCCFGWPVDNGTWMRDWDAPLREAVEAAEQAAEQPFVRGLLEMILSSEELPFNLSTDGRARLLDIAILVGDKESCAMI